MCKVSEDVWGNMDSSVRADKAAALGILPRIPKLPPLRWPLATSYGTPEL